MAMDCENIKSQVIRWFDSELECNSVSNDSLVITLPLLKPNGDHIEIGFEALGGKRFKISDLGETHATFFLDGLEMLEDSYRADEFRQVIADFGIKEDSGELSVLTDSGQLIERMFDFVHALQAVLALQLTTKPQAITRDFASVVAKFLAEQHASFEIPSGPIRGKTGFWKFNFILNHVRPETMVKTLSVPSKSGALKSAKQTVFEILDIRAAVRTTPPAIVIADDEGPRSDYWQPRAMQVFRGYDVPIFSFEGNRKELISLAQEHAAQ